MVGKIIGIGITGMVGLLMTILGYLIWKKEKINLLHDYHIYLEKWRRVELTERLKQVIID